MFRIHRNFGRRLYATSTPDRRVIFEAVPGNAVRLLKFMSATGSIVGCTATAAAAISHYQGTLADTDLGVLPLALASAVSLASTMAVTRMFGPFVTRITLVPPTRKAQGIQINRQGLPKFDSIFQSSERITLDTRIVLRTPGLLGMTSRDTGARIGELVPAAGRFRTWRLAPSAVSQRRKQGVRVPLTTFTILWKSIRDSPNKELMREINSLVGSR